MNFSHPDLWVVCSQGKNLSSGLTGSLFSRGKLFSRPDLRAVCSQGKTSHPELRLVCSQGGKPVIRNYRQSVLKGKTFYHPDLGAVCSHWDNRLSSGLTDILFSRGKPLIRLTGSLFSRGKPLVRNKRAVCSQRGKPLIRTVLKGKTSHSNLRVVCSQAENLSSGLTDSLFSRGKPLIQTYGQSVLKGKTSRPE